MSIPHTTPTRSHGLRATAALWVAAGALGLWLGAPARPSAAVALPSDPGKLLISAAYDYDLALVEDAPVPSPRSAPVVARATRPAVVVVAQAAPVETVPSELAARLSRPAPMRPFMLEPPHGPAQMLREVRHVWPAPPLKPPKPAALAAVARGAAEIWNCAAAMPPGAEPAGPVNPEVPAPLPRAAVLP
jgi:hypothetical protein